MQLKSAAKISSLIWLSTKHANCRMDANQSSCKVTNDQCVCTAFAQRPLCALCSHAELLLRCRRPYCVAMVTLLRPLCALLGHRAKPSDSVCFEYAQSARRRSAFYAIPPRPMAMPLRCCSHACVLTALTSSLCIFLGRPGITVRTPPWCDRGFTVLTSSTLASLFFNDNIGTCL